MYELGKREEAEEEGFIYSLGWGGEVLVDSRGDDASPRILGDGNLGKPREGAGNFDLG